MCVNREKVCLTKEDLAYLLPKLNTCLCNKINNCCSFCKFIGVVSFIIGMIVAKKWFNARNTAVISIYL